MKKLVFLIIFLMGFGIVIGINSEGYSFLYTINAVDVKQVTVENCNKNSMKLVTSNDDIERLVGFADSLRFKAADKAAAEKLRKNGKEEAINYHIIIGDIVLNINSNMIFYRGQWYNVNLNAEDFVSRLYDKLNYSEYGTIL
ncbi:MAG: hypothetical protein Q8930_09370 [Bacillota bacterium]|nr:hypothetical protein [Bacillota bacterium]